MPAKLKQENVAKELSSLGIRLLSEYKTTNSKMTVQCLKDDYIWEPTLGNLRAGHKCPKCSNRPRITRDDVETLVSSRGGKLGDIKEPIHAKDKLTIQCLKDNHIWHPTWDDIKNGGNWCPKCAGKFLMTYDEFEEYIHSKDADIVSGPKTFISTDKFTFKCRKDGHIWTTSYVAITYNGSWCPKCAGKVLRSFDEVVASVEARAGRMISKASDLKCNTSKLTVQCGQCHRQWDISYHNLMTGNRWCPYCKTSYEQDKLMHMIADIFNAECVRQFKGFDWLKDKRRMEIDIWLPSIKLGIEYDGPHHYIAIIYSGDKERAEKKLKDRKRKDRLKTRLIKKHPQDVQYFLRFNYKEPLTKEYVVNKLKKYKVPLP